MPYASLDELPENVKGLPEKLQRMWLEVFNSVYKQTKDDERAAKAAWSKVNEQREHEAELEKIELNTFVRDRPRYYNTILESNKFERTASGLLVRDVILLAEGTWADSNVRTPCYYSPEVLEKYAQNWKENGLWSRHPGGSPRTVADKIGYVKNTYYSPEYKAIMGDLLFHMKSQLSRDIAEMVQDGLVNAVSVEIGGEEYYNRKTHQNEAVSINGYGVAVVDKGACDVCTIRHKAADDAHIHDDKILRSDEDAEQPPEEGNDLDLEELNKKVEALAAKVSAIEEKMAPKQEEKEEPKGEDDKERKEASAADEAFKALAGMVNELKVQLPKVNERIESLEKTAKPRSMSTEDKPKALKTLIGRADF